MSGASALADLGVFATLTFEPILITDLFHVHTGSGASNKQMGSVPYIAASFQNNGIVGYVNKPKYEGGWLSLVKDGDGGAGKCFYQPVPFWPSNHVFALEPKKSGIPASALLCVAALITHQCFNKYSRGHAINLTRLSRQKIMVPTTFEGGHSRVVDWGALARLGDEISVKVKSRIPITDQISDCDEILPELNFQPMLINSVFDSIKASSAWCDKVNLKSGVVQNLYLSQTKLSNGLDEIVAWQGMSPEPGNCITMTLKTQAIFYQPCPFYTAQNFLILRHPSLDVDSAMVLVTVLRRAAAKFSWGYGISMGRISKTHVMVPVIGVNGEKRVDWLAMRNYGRVLRLRTGRNVATLIK
ncbi:MAG: restriction endonuclease subunit S [Roseomonas sp.]|nr:restriction endonuclease subunit S [Roseomonas sp.]